MFTAGSVSILSTGNRSWCEDSAYFDLRGTNARGVGVSGMPTSAIFETNFDFKFNNIQSTL